MTSHIFLLFFTGRRHRPEAISDVIFFIDVMFSGCSGTCKGTDNTVTEDSGTKYSYIQLNFMNRNKCFDWNWLHYRQEVSLCYVAGAPEVMLSAGGWAGSDRTQPESSWGQFDDRESSPEVLYSTFWEVKTFHFAHSFSANGYNWLKTSSVPCSLWSDWPPSDVVVGCCVQSCLGLWAFYRQTLRQRAVG